MVQQFFADQIAERFLGSPCLADLARGVTLLIQMSANSLMIDPPHVRSTPVLSRRLTSF